MGSTLLPAENGPGPVIATDEHASTNSDADDKEKTYVFVLLHHILYLAKAVTASDSEKPCKFLSFCALGNSR